MKNNKGLLVVLLLIVVIVAVIYIAKKKEVVPPISVSVSDTTSGTPAATDKEVCYFKETVGEESTDDAFTSINYDAGGKVHGIINWIPGEKDSLVGVYTGTVEKNEGMSGYPTRLNIIYSGWGEGILSKQQEIIIVGANDIKTGTGEMYKDTDGVWKIKNTSNLTYDNALPMVDCASVEARFKTDYSKNAN